MAHESVVWGRRFGVIGVAVWFWRLWATKTWAGAAGWGLGQLRGGPGRAYRQWALANPTHYLVMFGRAVPDYEPSDGAGEKAGASFQALIEAVAVTGAAPTDLEALGAAYHLYATVHGYVMLELVGMGPVDGEHIDKVYENGLRRALESIGLG